MGRNTGGNTLLYVGVGWPSAVEERRSAGPEGGAAGKQPSSGSNKQQTWAEYEWLLSSRPQCCRVEGKPATR